LTKDQILEQLTQIFRSVFDDDTLKLTPSSSANDIEEWDSLNQIKIILACEHAFKIKLNPRKISTLENVGQMLDYLERELAADGKG
jgi:acyl carrier protein